MSIKEKLEKYEFFLENAPCILDMNNRRVLVNKEAPNPNELASFEDYNSYWEEVRVVTQKLKVESYGDWELSVAVVNTKHFENRQTLNQSIVSLSIRNRGRNKAIRKSFYPRCDIDVPS